MKSKLFVGNKTKLNYFLLIAFTILGLLARFSFIHHTNVDTDIYLVPWYDYISSNGIIKALGDKFANYTPPYTYLLSMVTLVPIPKIVAIKLIPIVMDAINSFIVYKIVKLKYPTGLASLWAAVILWCLPTVLLNSAWWGQADSFYTGFLLLTLYFLILNRPISAMSAFSVSVAFKLQAIFMGPFLVILFLGSVFKPNVFLNISRIKLWHFFLIPIIYSLMCLPAVLLGRGWLDVWSIYLEQANTFKRLSANAPNLYVFISDKYFHPVSELGLVFAALTVFVWIAYTIKKESNFSVNKLVLTALTSVAIVPFLLPKMHERYFYPADLISLVIAFYMPKLWFLPVGFQIISCLSYYPFLSNNTWASTSVKYAALVNIILIAFIVWKQLFSKSNSN